ncbi:phage tail tape measure protein [Dickeya zeae]|uniref:phage tail tape measure protein n=1 Tax=Dickeya zeae TaxID=204042 RepID=UPI00143FFC77|nr:phage tail tape measure protein [Dickeya zeae]QIZ47429.1 phage tail tape measure protein [Dickeya zeae]
MPKFNVFKIVSSAMKRQGKNTGSPATKPSIPAAKSEQGTVVGNQSSSVNEISPAGARPGKTRPGKKKSDKPEASSPKDPTHTDTSSPPQEKKQPGLLGKLRDKVMEKLSSISPEDLATGTVTSVQKIMEPGYDFSRENASLQASLGLKPDDQIAKYLTAQAKAIADTTPLTHADAVRAQHAIVDLGATDNTVLAVTPSAVSLSQVNQRSVNDSAALLMEVDRAFQLKNANYTHIGDVASVIIQKTEASFDSFKEGLATAAPTAHKAGVSFEDTSIMLGALADSGLDNADGKTNGARIQALIQRLNKPTDNARQLLSQLNIAPSTAQGKLISPLTTLEQIGKRFEQDNVSQSQRDRYLNTIFGSQGGAAANILIEGLNHGNTGVLRNRVQDSSGVLTTSYDTSQNTLAGDISKLQSKTESMQVKLYESAEGTARDLVQAGSRQLDKLTPHSSSNSALSNTPGVLSGTDGVDMPMVNPLHTPSTSMSKAILNPMPKVPKLPLIKDLSLTARGNMLAYMGSEAAEQLYGYYTEHPEQQKYLGNNYLFGNDLYEATAADYLEKHKKAKDTLGTTPPLQSTSPDTGTRPGSSLPIDNSIVVSDPNYQAGTVTDSLNGINYGNYSALSPIINQNYADNRVINNNVQISMPEGTQYEQLHEKVLSILNEYSQQQDDRHLSQMNTLHPY